jgi:hypothetical protein
LRVVGDAEQNLRLNPATGAVAATDTALAYAGTDVNAAANPNVAGSAYTNNFAGATATSLFGIDSALDVLTLQNPPNNGTLNTIGALGVDSSSVAGFDIGSATGTPYAALTAGGVSNLYGINLVSGAATLIGAVGGGAQLRGLAAAIAGGSLQFSSATYSVNENDAGATLTVTRSGGLIGALSVNYATSDATAIANGDYNATSGTLNFAEGETSKTFTVPITSDQAVENDESVNLTLSAPGGGAALGTQASAVLTIVNDDKKGGGGGGGCVIASDARFDPALLVLVLGSLALVASRRRARACART